MKDRQTAKITTLSENIARQSYCGSRISIESQLHAHDFYEFVICVSGKMENVYNREISNVMEKGSVYLARPKEVHKINYCSSAEFLHDDVYISKKKMQKICTAFSDNLFDKINSIKGPITFSLDFDKLNGISDAVYKLSNVVDRTADSEEQHAFLIVRLLRMVFEKYLSKKETSIPKWLIDVKEKISMPENFIVPLGELLENSFYSRSYVSVAFKKYIGETVVEYRNRLKVKYSVSMLAENDMSVNEIAGILGWDNPNNYIIAFKKVYGLTPLQYKNSLFKNE